MRGLLCLPALVVLVGGTAWAQQGLPPTIQDGPMTMPAAKAAAETAPAQDAAAVAQNAPAVPDANGVYRRGAGLMLPGFAEVKPVAYPANAPAAEPPRNCVLSVTVSAEGVPSEIKVLRSLNAEADKAMVDALSKTLFEPGTLDGKPVAMEVEVALHFFSDSGTAVPHVRWSGAMGAAHRTRKWDQPPVATHTVEAEFSEEARRAGAEGTVLIELTVSEEGLPTNIRVLRPLDKGLSEKAVQAVSQYRFRPAMKDGKPVAATINIEISFHLYRRPGN